MQSLRSPHRPRWKITSDITRNDASEPTLYRWQALVYGPQLRAAESTKTAFSPCAPPRPRREQFGGYMRLGWKCSVEARRHLLSWRPMFMLGMLTRDFCSSFTAAYTTFQRTETNISDFTCSNWGFYGEWFPKLHVLHGKQLVFTWGQESSWESRNTCCTAPHTSLPVTSTAPVFIPSYIHKLEEAISEPVLSLLPSLTTAFRRRTVETSNKGCDDSHLGSAMNAIGTEWHCLEKVRQKSFHNLIFPLHSFL